MKRKNMKRKKPMGNMTFIKKYADKHIFFLYLSVFFSMVAPICFVMPSYFIYNIVKNIINSTGSTQFYLSQATYAFIIIVIGMLSELLSLLSSHLCAFKVESNLKSKGFKILMQKSLGFFDNRDSGELRKNLDDNASGTHAMIAHNIPESMMAIFTPIVLFVLMFVVDWRLGLLTLVVPVVSLFIMLSSMMIISKKSKANMKEYMSRQEEISANGIEYLRGIAVVKMYQQSDKSFSNFKNSILSYGDWILKYTLSFRFPMTVYSTLSALGFSVLISYFFMKSGSFVSYGDKLASLIFFILISTILPTRTRSLASTMQTVMIFNQLKEKLNSLLNEDDIQSYGTEEVMENANIEFKNVRFKYPGTDRDVIKDISFNVKQGTLTGIVGDSGGGKSTIAKLIPRFYDIDEGEILIGGKSVKSYSKNALMKNISFVFQSTKLFHGTIRDNLLIAKKDVTEEEIYSALEKAQAKSIVDGLSDGLDTMIGSDGVYLSGGEQQRIVLARAILKDAPIIILDEATAFADPENEKEIQIALSNLIKNKSVIMIAHRLPTIANADQILLVENGSIDIIGTNDYLLNNSPKYKDMWNKYQSSLEWSMGGKNND